MDNPGNEREVVVRFVYETDKQSAEAAARATEKLNQGVKKVGTSAQDTTRKFQQMKEQAENMGRIANLLMVGGTAILAPIALAAKNYVAQADQADIVSKRWQASMERINQAGMRIGRVAAQEILPYLERAAVLAEKVAAWIERNPGAVDAALKLGAIMFVSGSAVKALQMAYGTIGAAGVLLSRMGIIGAGGAAATGAGSAAGAVAGGAAAGVGIVGGLAALIPAAVTATLGYLAYEGVRRTDYGKNLPGGVGGMLGTAGQAAGQLATLGAAGLAKLFGQDPAKWAEAVGKLTGAIKDVGEAAGNAAPEVTKLSDAAKAYADYQQQEADATQQYEEQRSKLVEQYGEERAAIEQRTEEQRTSITARYQEQLAQMAQQYADTVSNLTRSYTQSEAQAEQDYYKQRTQAAKAYHIEVQRAEQDHQREMRRMQKEHQNRVNDLVASRDALGLVAEMRSYNQQRQDAEENYRIEQQRRSQDFAMQLQQMDEQYAQERAKAAQQYAQDMADAANAYADQKKQAAQAYATQLKDLQVQEQKELAALQKKHTAELQALDREYQVERQRRYNAFLTQLRDLDVYLGKEQETRKQYYDRMEADYKAWLAKMQAATPNGGTASGTNGTTGSRQGGGPVWPGLWKLHAGEYVMNEELTNAATAVAGGTLTNESLMRTLLQSARNTINYNDHRRVNGQISAQDRMRLRLDTIRTVEDLLNAAV